MKRIAPWLLFHTFAVQYTLSYKYDNTTIDHASQQLADFKQHHPEPIGLLTSSAGQPIDLRKTITLNTDIFSNVYFFDTTSHIDAERIPERVVHAKGTGAFGYFEVTHDVSKYTKADVFNEIGKKTPVVVRFSEAIQSTGASDLAREPKGLSIKFYTREGNLDLLCFNIPVFFHKDPILFTPVVHAFKRNPQTNLFDNTALWDIVTLKPEVLNSLFWIFSDFAIPNGYRKMDAFPIHTYEMVNKLGEKYYIRFNFRTEQGLENLSSAQAMMISGSDPDYYVRDLFNAIASKNYPSWRLEMDVLSPKDIKHVGYNPFDVTRTWKNGTYYTVIIGRVVLNRNPDNFFKDIEQLAFHPSNLVPGIPGPLDSIFRARRFSYRDTQNYRLGINHDKIKINLPMYVKTYNRDGVPPVKDNMRNAPNYYPNSFNGPVPYVDEALTNEHLSVLNSNAVDLEPAANFYKYTVTGEAHKQRFVNNTATRLLGVTPLVYDRVIKLLSLTDKDLSRRVSMAVEMATAAMYSGERTLLGRTREKCDPSSNEDVYIYL